MPHVLCCGRVVSATISSSGVTVADSWTASFSPAGDAAFGGADNNVVPGSASLSVVSGVTTVSFSRYLRASDAVDTAIGTGATPITFAYGSSAVPSYHGLQCVRRCARAILGAPKVPRCCASSKCAASS